jgi:uncharacterized membrane protein
MPEFLNIPTVQAGIAVLVLCLLMTSGFWLLSIFRDYAAHDRLDPNDVLANLREMHSRGDISDEEFRTIQAKTERDHTRKSPLDGGSSSGNTPEPPSG